MTKRHLLAIGLLFVSALAQAQAQARELPDRFWGDAWRGWHFYEDPEPELERLPPPKASAATPKTSPPTAAAKAPELVEFERLQKTLEDVRNIAIMRPTEANVRRYMELEAKVVARASTFADVAQRVAWSTPELDPTLQGRPVNAKALEVFEQQQLADRSRSIAELGRDHVLIFFFRGDCPYCHAFAPTLEAFQARHGIRIESVSVDGGTMPGFPDARRDNGIATALRVTQVPAVYLAQPFTGKITPIGFGVLSEAQLLERITAVSAPGYDAMVPSTTRQVALP
jgi:conjugal transfer pilus assembly protein TraF